MHTQDVPDRSAIDQALKDDHRKLEQTFQRVLDRFRGGDADAIRAAWIALDSELESHLKAEEELILPKFAKAAPAAAARIVREHAQIRAALERLGVDLDLHALCEGAAADFISALRAHAAFEDESFYAWAEAQLTKEERHAVLRRLADLVAPRARVDERDAVRK